MVEGVVASDSAVGDDGAGRPLYPPSVAGPPAPLPLLRFLYTFVQNPLRALPRPVYERPFLAYRGVGPGIVWVTDPALVERILLGERDKFPKTEVERRVFGPALGDGILTAEGASWRWQRKIAAPLFRHQDLLRLVPDIAECGEGMLEGWRTQPGERLRAIEQDMTDVTYDVITRTILSGAAVAEGAEIKRLSHALLVASTWEIAAALVRAPRWLWHPGKTRLNGNSARLRGIVRAIVTRHRDEHRPDSGLLGRLVAARDLDSGAPMSDESIVDNLLTFLLAGQETTAKALTWTLYLLARAPDWQDKVRAEVDAVARGEAIGPEHLDRLVVTTQVLKEAMRLYPPAPVLTRHVAEPVEIGGQSVGAGTLVVIPIYAVHRHRSLWKDPDRFDPGRFVAGREEARYRTQFMPFGFGPRTCIGMSFAIIEASVLLATLVRGARFAWDGSHAPEPVSRITLRPKGGMPLLVEPLLAR